ncbi:MAG: septal ring lytic transglycosylase RlpA family protein [Candidatus Kerfeldbacteria bacterium]
MHHTTISTRLFIAVFIFSAFILGSAQAAFAAGKADTPSHIPAVRIRMDKPTIQKGFTIESEGQKFRIGVTDHAVGERDEAFVRLKPVFDKDVTLKGETLLSKLYSFDIYNKETIPVYKPIWMSIKWEKESSSGMVVKYWDSNAAAWIELPSSINEQEQWMQAAIHLPYAIVGVFEKEEVYVEGKASWYDWHGAAMNGVPMGTVVKVINKANGKSAITTIVSTGPFVPGRVIDLTRGTFSEIADLATGVIDVIVIIKENTE